MQFTLRATVAILSAVGAGTIGFWMAWTLNEKLLSLDFGAGRDALFLSSIFAPGIFVALWVFRSVSLIGDRKVVEPTT